MFTRSDRVMSCSSKVDQLIARLGTTSIARGRNRGYLTYFAVFYNVLIQSSLRSGVERVRMEFWPWNTRDLGREVSPLAVLGLGARINPGPHINCDTVALK